MYRPDALPATQPTVSKHWRLPTYTHTHLYSGKNRENEVRLAVSSKTRCQYCNFSYVQHHFQFSYSCFTAKISTNFTSTQTIDQSCISTAVQVIKSLQDPLQMGNNLLGISDNVRERGVEQKCFQTLTEGWQISRCPADCCRWWVRRLISWSHLTAEFRS